MKKIIQKLFNLFGYSLIRYKNFEKLYRNLDTAIKPLIQINDPVIFDVGAHEGETIKRFNNLFTNPEIHSFEPQNKCFELLKKFKNKKTFINNYALGDKEEQNKIYVNNDDSSSSIHNIDNNSNFLKNLKNVSQQDINISTLDEYIKKNNINHIDILKIDVQGYEDKVLLGSINSLSKISLIEIEIIFVDYYESKKSFYEIEKILNPFGFKLHSLSTPGLTENYQVKWIDALYVLKK